MARTTTTRSKTKSTKVSKKTVSTKTVKANTKKSLTIDLETLRKFHIFSFALLVGLAITAFYLMNSTGSQLFVSLLARDALASQVNTVFVPAIHTVVDVRIMWLVISVALISAMASLLYTTKLSSQYNRGVRTRFNLWRWIEIAVVGMIMIETVAVLNGVVDVMSLKMIGGFVIMGAVLGALSERQNSGKNKRDWTLFIVSQVSNVFPWLVIATSVVSTLVYGMVRSPWYVYAASLATLIGFVLMGTMQYRQIKNLSSKVRYEVIEFGYQKIGLLTKLAFVGTLIVGLKK